MVSHIFTVPEMHGAWSGQLDAALADDPLSFLKRFLWQALRAFDSELPENPALRHACLSRETGSLAEQTDAYALHFVAQASDAVAGTLRVTCRQDGPVESRSVFPAWVLTKFGQRTAGTQSGEHPEITDGSQITELLQNFRGPIAKKLEVNVNLYKARVEQRFRTQNRWIAALEWSPDGARLASAGRNGTIKVWNSSTGEELSSLDGHSAEVIQLAWNNTSQRLASSSLDGSVRIWEPDRGREVMLVCQQKGAAYVTWNKDGTRLATMAADGYQRIWEIQSQ